jgi:formamidopyrimidine-DNA glycosylase
VPELPEVEALARFLADHLTGRTIRSVEVGQISALRTVQPGPSDLVGARIMGVRRAGKWIICTATDGQPVHLVWHLARAGWLRWSPRLSTTPVRPGRSPIALRVRLDDDAGFDLTEAGTRKRLAVHVVRDPSHVGPVASLGVDPLSGELTFERFSRIAAARNQQIKGLLRDQHQIAGIGNAYSDEILLVARTSPFALTGSMSDETLHRVHTAIIEVLAEAVAAASGRPASQLKDAKRRGLRVHGRTGEPCGGWDLVPCGDTIREVSFADTSLQYCPTCQTGGRLLADRRLSRLLR